MYEYMWNIELVDEVIVDGLLSSKTSCLPLKNNILLEKVYINLPPPNYLGWNTSFLKL